MQDKTIESNTGGTGRLLILMSGIVALIVGLIASGFGRAWSPQVYDFLFSFQIIEYFDAFTPYFPGVPFYPLFVLILGAFLIVKSRG